MRAPQPMRAAFSATRAIRRGDRSAAATRAARSAIPSAFPPGAAARSITVAPSGTAA